VVFFGVFYFFAHTRLDGGIKKGEQPKLEKHPKE
jgi:hypothetical protein